ncbi:F-type H+-transporting ATPase subunit a [Clostridium sp. DSM 8431]|uniref:F0F1 ATP synthase subunit A n=1 Tax=Clostridium sp. DSM 8431 TaxID=1761781 RepID=UPI0008F2907A|nr:F0F1 ATP synthase subunit A [Clostridium sp. DSM 8431]SFU49672.1 F-type H+-transporting ATPase subunit a [Clostridium sp. DSM 8431]
MEQLELIPIFQFNIGSFHVLITKEIVWQWIAIAILGVSAFLLTRNLDSKKTSKKQVVLEMLYETVEGLVKGNMGDDYLSYIPYIGTLLVYLCVLNLSGLIGIAPPTKCLGVTFGLGLSTFLVLNYTALKRNGVKGYFKAFVKPFTLFLPINIMERIVLPCSLALRLFGNMLAGTILIDLVYNALAKFLWISGIGMPVILHGYFDVFDGLIQVVVFAFLTMANIKATAEH